MTQTAAYGERVRTSNMADYQTKSIIEWQTYTADAVVM